MFFLITNIILAITTMFIFLTIFYFTFAKNTEGEIVQEQIIMLLNNLIPESIKYLPENEKQKILNSLDKIDFSKQDLIVENNNIKIIKKTFKYLFLFICLTLSIVLFCVYIFKLNIKHLLLDNFYTLIFVAIAEILFLLSIAKNYYSIDPNEIKSKILKKIYYNSNKNNV